MRDKIVIYRDDCDGICLAIYPEDREGVVHITRSELLILERRKFDEKCSDMDYIFDVGDAQDLLGMFEEVYAKKIKECEDVRVPF